MLGSTHGGILIVVQSRWKPFAEGGETRQHVIMIKPRPELQTNDLVSAFLVRWNSALEDPLIDIDVPFDPYSILSKDV